MRIIGLDIHRVFAEGLENGKLKRLGRVDMHRDRLAALSNSPAIDAGVVEATGNAATARQRCGGGASRIGSESADDFASAMVRAMAKELGR
jgi:hypothetical protein